MQPVNLNVRILLWTIKFFLLVRMIHTCFLCRCSAF